MNLCLHSCLLACMHSCLSAYPMHVSLHSICYLYGLYLSACFSDTYLLDFLIILYIFGCLYSSKLPRIKYICFCLPVRTRSQVIIACTSVCLFVSVGMSVCLSACLGFVLCLLLFFMLVVLDTGHYFLLVCQSLSLRSVLLLTAAGKYLFHTV